MIENWGTGFYKIYYLNRENGNIDVNLSEKTGAFIITFFKKINEGINKGINKGTNEGINVLLNYIKNNPGKHTNELARSINIPEKTVERWIKELKGKSKIEYKGSKRTGGYYIV